VALPPNSVDQGANAARAPHPKTNSISSHQQFTARLVPPFLLSCSCRRRCLHRCCNTILKEMDRPFLFQTQAAGLVASSGPGRSSSSSSNGATRREDSSGGVGDYAAAAAAAPGRANPHALFAGGGGGSSDHQLSFFAPSQSSSSSSSSSLAAQQMMMQQHLQMTMVPILLYRPAPPPTLPLSQTPERYIHGFGKGGTTGIGGGTTVHSVLPSDGRGPERSQDTSTAGSAMGAGAGGLQLLFEASLLQEEQESNRPSPQALAADPPQPFSSSSSSSSLRKVPPHSPAIKRRSLPLSSSFNNASHAHSHSSPGSSSSSTSRLSSNKRRRLAKVVVGTKSSKASAKAAAKVVAKYNIMDVLCGRGGLANRHDGNLVYRKVVDANKAFYKTVTNKRHRQYLAESIVLAIQQAGGRFLEQMNPVSKRAMMMLAKASEPPNIYVGTSTFVSPTESKVPEKDAVWKEVPFQKAVLKTSQALRETDKWSSGGKGSGGGGGLGTGAAASASGSESPVEQQQQQHERHCRQRTSLPWEAAQAATMLSPPAPAPLSPPPRLLNQPTTTSLSLAVAASTAVTASAVRVLDATNDVASGNSSNSNGTASLSVATASSSSSSVANYHDARQDARAGEVDGNDDGDRGAGERAVEEDDDDWSSSSSSASSASTSSSAAPASHRYRRGAGVSFVPVASSHLALSGAFFQQQAAKAG
jgi:hypothetical protein